MKKVNYKRFWLCYTGLFILIAVIIYSFFFRNGKSFVYALYGDGHICFNSLVYYGRWLREIIINLFQNHTFQIPMWDMSIGYGSDILTTFNWMTLGDPLNLLAVFFSSDKMEYLYGFLAVFRIYLCGITFSVYALAHDNKRLPVLMGSLVYAFCGFSLFAGVRDVYFMSPMIYLPLLLLGVDKIFRKQKPHLFIFFVALSAITNFYYFYMLTIWVFIYGVYRYFMLFGKEGRSIKKIGQWLLQCILYYLVGILMAAFLLIPIIMHLLGSERFANQDYVPLMYSFEYYWKLIVRFTTSESMEAWTHLGYAPVAVIAIIVMFIKRDKKYLAYKIGFCMCIAFLMIPAVGSLMNAGSYVVNRWVWAFSMLVAYIFVKISPELLFLNKKEKRIVSVICCGYVLLCCLRGTYRTTQMLTMQLILLISLVFILAASYLYKKNKRYEYLILACVLLGVAANGCLRYASFGSNYANGFVEAGRAWPLIHNDLPSRDLEDLQDREVVRYDSLGTLEPMYNTAMNHELNGTNFYFSLADGKVTRYFDDLWVNVEMEHRYKGMDERSILEHLAAVKYCVAGEEAMNFVPYGYDKVVEEKENYTIFENENSLPLGYTYDSVISFDEYNKLDAIKKQQVLLQNAVIQKSGLPEGETEFTDRIIPYKLDKVEGIEIQENRFVVMDSEAELTIQIDSEANSETYLVFNGICYEKGENTDQEEAHVIFTKGVSNKKLVLYSKKHAFYHGREDYIINMGYSKDKGIQEIKIKFTRPGVYYYNTFKAVCQPMEQIPEQIEARKESVLQNVNISINTIRGTISSEREKLLCVAIPYSKGWTAYVDGEKTNVKQMNGMYLGIEIQEGEHEVLLKYMTPCLKAGMLLSLLGFVCFAGIHIRQKRV